MLENFDLASIISPIYQRAYLEGRLNPCATAWARVIYGERFLEFVNAPRKPLPRLVRLDWLKILWENYLDTWDREGPYLP